MKIKLVVLCFLFFLNGFCQNISLKKIISLRNENRDEIYNFLIEKKWNYLSETHPSKNDLGSVVFIFNIKNKTSFITYLFSDDKKIKRIEIQIKNIEDYKSYISEIKLLKFQYISTSSNKKEIIKVYQNNKTTIQITESNYNNSKYYLILVTSNLDYLNNY